MLVIGTSTTRPSAKACTTAPARLPSSSTATMVGCCVAARIAKPKPTARMSVASEAPSAVARSAARLFQNWLQALGAAFARDAAAGTPASILRQSSSPTGCGSAASSKAAKRVRQHSTSRANAGVRGKPPFGVELGGAFEQAQHIFAGQRFVVAVGHPMHSCKEIRLRRAQLFTVPSGTPSLPATSPCESP